MSPRPLAVVDVDGVVADVRHRLRHLERRPRDWGAFFASAAADPPFEAGLRLVQALRAGHDVVWLTGRPEWLRSVTEEWLVARGLPAGPLRMRGHGDRRPARVFKLGHVRRLDVEGRIAVVVDDDPEVVEALRAEGWPAILANWVPQSRTLGAAQEREGRT